MAEYRNDGIWEVVPEQSSSVHLVEPDRRHRVRRRWDPDVRAGSDLVLPPIAPRPRIIGWSVAVVGASNVGLLIVALVIGMSPIGLVACAALALSSWFLVVAEVLSLRRLYQTSERR